jgi:RNA-directed DNA polymerase
MTKKCKYGSFVIGRKTIKKRMRSTLQAIKMELRKRLHDPIAKTGARVYSVLKGHLNYFAVSGNDPSLWWFFTQVKWRRLRSLRRRSQRAYINWARYIRLIDCFLPPITILHPIPCHRFDARTRERSPVR